MTEQPQVNSAGNTASQQQAVSALSIENAAKVAALLYLEKQAVDAASGPLRVLLRNVLRTLSVRYVLAFGDLDHPADPERVQPLIDTLVADLEPLRQYDPAPKLQPFIDQARGQGVVWGNQYLADPVQQADIEPSAAVDRLLSGVELDISDSIDAAQQFAQQADVTGWSDTVRLVGKASQAATGLERSIAVALSTTVNDTIGQIAARRGARLLWVAEPDACVVCLALSGHLADPSTGEWFDEEATFGKPGSAPAVWPPDEPLDSPPRHPNCRCIMEIWHGAAVPAGGAEETALYNRPGIGARVDLPAALRREAKRSIVYGWSVPSESGVVRLEAASRLLAHGAGLPKSVEARGRAAVKSGKFDNRVHPSRKIVRRSG